MAEIKRKPVVYTYGPEGRDACWAALTNSWNELARRQKKSSSSDELMAWTTTRPEETGEIDSTTQTTTTTSMTMPETATVEMATTPPPPPMMRSPPKLERRTAGGGHHRRRSYHEWDTPPANCRDVGSDGFRPSDLANLLECMQPPDLGLADSCGNYDCGGGTGGRYKFDWNDDASAAERVREHRPPLSCAGDWSDRSLPSTPGSLQSNVVIEEEATMFVDGHEVTNTGVEHEVMNTVDEHEVTITVVLDEPTVAAVVLDEPTVAAVVLDEPTVAAVVLDEPTVAAVVQDEPTVTAVVQESDTSNASDPSLPSRRRAGEDEARHDDEQTGVDKPQPQPPQPPLPRASEYDRETRIKEIDETIVSYSKSLLITVLVVVLIRVLF